MHVHVFAIDILPLNDLICSGGGLRSWQLIGGLRELGVDVSYSMPANSSLVKQQWDQLTVEQRDSCYGYERGHRLIDIVHKFKPDVALIMWPFAFWSVGKLKEGMATVLDINGFQNVEAALFAGDDFQKATDHYLQKMDGADILITGSAEQRAYWAGLRGYHRNDLAATPMIDVPFCLDRELIDSAAARPYSGDGPRFFCTGTFLPWNSPQGQLLRLARLIEAAGQGELHVVGRPLLSETYAREVLDELEAVARYPFARIEAGMSFAAMVEAIERRGIAIDLHLPTFERQFALPVRTMTYLGLGMPVVFNNYSTLAAQVQRYGAGYCIDVASDQAFEDTVTQILSEPDAAGRGRMSDAAIRLVRETYATDAAGGMRRLVASMEERLALLRAPRPRQRPTVAGGNGQPPAALLSPFINRRKLPRVLVISDDFENLKEVRVHLPFRAMREKQLIEDYIVLSQGRLIRRPDSSQLRDIDVVWVQRRPMTLLAPALFAGRYVLDLDDNFLVSPAYRPAFAEHWLAVMRTLMHSAGTVTTTGPRLVEALQRHSHLVIEHKVVMAPNMTADVRPKSIASPSALLLASSDNLPLTSSKEAFSRAIRRFTELRGLPLLYIGTPANQVKKMAPDVREVGMLSYQRYLQVLRDELLMAVVPLEGHGDPLTDDFVTGKSDIKMVEFGAASVPAVYSRVAPFSESPLDIGPLADFGDTNALIEALDQVFRDANRQAKLACDRVREQRLARDVVDRWYEAIERERFVQPVSLELIQSQAIRFLQLLNADIPARAQFDEATYASVYPDAVEWARATGQSIYAHYLRYGRSEGRRWHIGDPNTGIEQTAVAVRDLIYSLDADWQAVSQRVAAALGEGRP